MYPQIFIYKSFCLQTYGLSIVSGILLAIFLVHRDKRCHNYGLIKHIMPALCTVIMGSIIGGRMLFCLEQSWQGWYAIWNGGFCILGALIGGWTSLHVYSRFHKLALLHVLDCTALYVPLVQAIARIGCFLSGCCFGAPLMHPPLMVKQWFNPSSQLYHPTQLYSSAFFFIVFFGLRWYEKRYGPSLGNVALTFSLLSVAERFFNDFLRADRFLIFSFVSLQQVVALGCFIGIGLYFGLLGLFSKRVASA